MGRVLLRGWLARGRAASTITVVDPAPAWLPEGMTAVAALPPDYPPPRVVVLAVKPQMLAKVAPNLANAIGPRTVLISLLAAVEVATLRAHFPFAGSVVRTVPNLPGAIGQGITALAGNVLDEQERSRVGDLFAPLGALEWLGEERLCDAATSVSGCGPAFLFRYADAVVRAGVEQGLDADQARRLIAATMIGAGTMLRDSTESPAEMARRVASPAGVTLAGLAVLDRDDALARLLGEALAAAARRNAEMAAEARVR
jgi:pyrroline-5-carboxylate reductase